MPLYIELCRIRYAIAEVGPLSSDNNDDLSNRHLYFENDNRDSSEVKKGRSSMSKQGRRADLNKQRLLAYKKEGESRKIRDQMHGNTK